MKKFQNITAKQLAEKGVRALADRPNASAQYGVSGLSPAQLKLWFDNLAVFLAERYNALQDTLSSKEAAEYIRIALDEYKVTSLDELVESMTSGDFAKNVLQVVPTVNSFSTVSLQKWIYDVTVLMNEHFTDGYYDGTVGDEAMVLTRESGDDIRIPLRGVFDYVDGIHHSIFVLQTAPSLSAIDSAVLLATPTLAQIAAAKYGRS